MREEEQGSFEFTLPNLLWRVAAPLKQRPKLVAQFRVRQLVGPCMNLLYLQQPLEFTPSLTSYRNADHIVLVIVSSCRTTSLIQDCLG